MTKYRKSWTQALHEVYHKEVEIDESTGLQMKMAFDDAKIKVKGVKGGKLIIDRNWQKEVLQVLTKSLKKGTNVQKAIQKFIKFEEVELDEKTAKIGDGENQYGSVVYKRMKKDRMLKGWADKVKGMEVVSRDYLEKLLPDHVPGQLITKVLEEVELAEKGTAYPATVDTL